MIVDLYNLWHKKINKTKTKNIWGYKTIHTFTKRIEDKTNDKNNNKSNNNIISSSSIINNNCNNNSNNNKTKNK